PLVHHRRGDLAGADDLGRPPPAGVLDPPLPAGRPAAAHHPPGAVDRAVERALGLLALDTLDDHADVAHRAADYAALARARRRRALPHHDERLAAVRFNPGIIVVIVDILDRARAEDAQHLRHHEVAPGVGVAPGQRHRREVGL